jgi:hypothetical protein
LKKNCQFLNILLKSLLEDRIYSFLGTFLSGIAIKYRVKSEHNNKDDYEAVGSAYDENSKHAQYC